MREWEDSARGEFAVERAEQRLERVFRPAVPAENRVRPVEAEDGDGRENREYYHFLSVQLLEPHRDFGASLVGDAEYYRVVAERELFDLVPHPVGLNRPELVVEFELGAVLPVPFARLREKTVELRLARKQDALSFLPLVRKIARFVCGD